MQTGPHIGEREREILTAIVETFIATGEPVGSRTLARANREGLSPATIRNVMADLSDAGLLEQPHTSAGRVPTTEAYRYYVEQLTGKARLSDDQRRLEALRPDYEAAKARLAEVGFTCEGSLVERYTSCHNPNCRCADPAQRHGPYWQISWKQGGRTVSRIISAEEAELYRSG